MYIFISLPDNVFVETSLDLDYQSNGNYLIHNGELAIPKSVCNMVELEVVPEYVEPFKYRYINEEFVPNPNWIDPEQPTDIDYDLVFGILKGEVE